MPLINKLKINNLKDSYELFTVAIATVTMGAKAPNVHKQTHLLTQNHQMYLLSYHYAISRLTHRSYS